MCVWEGGCSTSWMEDDVTREKWVDDASLCRKMSTKCHRGDCVVPSGMEVYRLEGVAEGSSR